MAVNLNFGVPVGGTPGSTLMPKLQYRFRVTFENLGGSTGTDEVTQNVISVSRPNLTHEEVVVDSYNSKMYLAGKHTWDPVTIVFRDDMNSNVIRKIGEQLNKQVDHASQSAAEAGSAYKFTVNVETLDGANPNPETYDQWVLKGAFIQNVQYGDLNYGTSEMVQVTLSLRYDHAEHIVSGDDLLSGEGQDRSQTGATS